MINQQEQCTLEPVQNYENQPGLELDFRNSGLEPDDRTSGLELDFRTPPFTSTTDTIIDEDFAKDVPEKIFGFKKKSFIIVAAIVTLLVMAVIAGITVGVTSKRRRNNKPLPPLPPPSPPATSDPPIIPATNILQNSSLASVNWTSGGLQYYGVFYQDRNNSIVMSLWDPKTTTWTPSPIAIDNVYNPLPGTHIAACAWNSTIFPNTTQVNVYITSKNDELLEFWTRDPYAGKWNLGDLTNKTPRSFSMHGSELAAYYWGCSNRTSCLNAPVLLYQTKDQLLKYTHARNGWSGDNFLESTFEAGTGMALMSLSPGGNDFNLNTTTDLKAYVGSAGNIAEYTWDKDRDRDRSKWQNQGGFFKNQTPPKAPLEIASTTLKSTTTSGWPDLLVLGLYLEGDVRTLKVMVGTGNVWNAATTPKMTNSINNITAMATNYDRRVYSISQGQIYEYEITRDPLSWDFKGVVRI